MLVYRGIPTSDFSPSLPTSNQHDSAASRLQLEHLVLKLNVAITLKRHVGVEACVTSVPT